MVNGSCRLTVRNRRHLRKVEKIKKVDKPVKETEEEARMEEKKRMITMALKRPLVRRHSETKN